MGAATIGTSRQSPLATLVALAMTDIAFAFQQTAIAPAIPQIQSDFAASETWSAWLLTGYLVISAVATPLLGKLADRYGKRRLLLVSLTMFLIGSVGAALAPSLALLVAFRALQGPGGAVFPITLSMLRDELPPGTVARAVGILTSAFGLGTSLGFGVSGVVIHAFGWRYIFLFGAAATLAALLLASRVLRRSVTGGAGRIDITGSALLTAGLGAMLVALSEGGRLGWDSIATLGCVATAAILLVGWLGHDARAQDPLIDLSVLRQRTVFLTNASTALLGYVVFGLYFIVPYLARDLLGAGPIATGLYLLPAALGQVVGGTASTWLARRLGAPRVLAGGMTLTAVGAAGLAAWHMEPWQLLGLVAVLGLGFGLGIGVASAVITQGVDARETGIATALNSVLRRVGGAVGGQVAAVLLVQDAADDSPFVLAFAASAAVAAVGAACALAIEHRRGRLSWQP